MARTYGEWLGGQRHQAHLPRWEPAGAGVTTRSHIAHVEAGRQLPFTEDARRPDDALNTRDTPSGSPPARSEDQERNAATGLWRTIRDHRAAQGPAPLFAPAPRIPSVAAGRTGTGAGTLHD